MASLDQIAGLIPRRVCIMGLPGSGKTTLAATLVSKFQLDWFDVESGAETLLKIPAELRPNINYFRIPDSATYPIAAETMMKVFKVKKATICYKHGKVSCGICTRDPNAVKSDIDFMNGYPTNRCMVIDTATQLGLSCLANVTRNKDVDYKPERDDWGALRKYTEFLASEIQGFPGNIIVIVHAMETQLEDGRTKLVPNFGSASMSAMFAKAFSHVIYTDVVNKKHVAYSSSTYSNNVLTKSRTDWEIEKEKEVSLLPLFKGLDTVHTDSSEGLVEIDITPSTVAENPQQLVTLIDPKLANSPAQNAVSGLLAKYKIGAPK